MKKGGMVTIDGRHGEGGGQILRTALTLSAILGIPLRVHHIRGNREKPGLRPQHLTAVNALARITGARVEGARVNSSELTLVPGKIEAGTYSFEIGTAGSTGLALQTVIPVLLYGKTPSQVQISGGTHVPWSPPFHYLQSIFAPVLENMGATVSLEIKQWGWYPRGGGRVRAIIENARGLGALHLSNRGELVNLHLLSAVSNLPLSIAERQRDQALKRIEHLGLGPSISMVDAHSPGQGTFIFLAAEFEGTKGGFTSLGRRGKSAEAVADEACDKLLRFLDGNGAVDRHLADQLVLYMALAKGRSTIVAETITEHLLTNIWVIEQFAPVGFEADQKTGTVAVNGIGLE
jgi:RNA 3'-terminal phosphate cyclase (ATP)